MANTPELEDMIKGIVEANYAGKIKALALVYIDDEGAVKQCYHIPAEVLLSMIGAIQIVNQAMSNNGINHIKPKDYLS